MVWIESSLASYCGLMSKGPRPASYAVLLGELYHEMSAGCRADTHLDKDHFPAFSTFGYQQESEGGSWVVKYEIRTLVMSVRSDLRAI